MSEFSRQMWTFLFEISRQIRNFQYMNFLINHERFHVWFLSSYLILSKSEFFRQIRGLLCPSFFINYDLCYVWFILPKFVLSLLNFQIIRAFVCLIFLTKFENFVSDISQQIDAVFFWVFSSNTIFSIYDFSCQIFMFELSR